jgi:hypothetical protein
MEAIVLMSQPTPDSPSFKMQFRSLLRIADDEQNSSQEFAARSIETRLKLLKLICDHIEAGGTITDVQRKHLTLKEKAVVHAYEFKNAPEVKEAVEDLRRGAVAGLTVAKDGIERLLDQLKKKK